MIMLKDLTEDKIEKLSDTQLYNLTFAPLIQDVREIDSFTQKQMDESAICVYGATIKPIKRRMEKLAKEVKRHNPKLIIFSGGFGWDGNNFKGVTSKELEKTWTTKTYQSRVNKRISDVIHCYPEIAQAVMEKMKEMWNEDKETSSDFDTFLNSYIEEIMEEYVQKMMHDKQFEEHLMGMYQKQIKETDKANFETWLKTYIKENFIRQFILNRCTEADFMQIIWDKVYNKDGNIKSKAIREEKSFVTCENAENCLQILQNYPDIKNLIVINEWPYVLRAVLTTKKVADRLGSNIHIMGLPADKSQDLGFEFKDMDDYRNLLITQIRKMVTYPDVGDMDITEYLNMKSFCEDGPSIKIGNRLYSFAEKNLDERE